MAELPDSFVTTTTKKIREHYAHILFPPEWPHTQDGQITDKRTEELEWEYAVASRTFMTH